MKIDGQCHCGAITFEGEADPARVVICHCADCQAMSGAPYRVNVPVLFESFRLRGEPKRYAKMGSSGAQIVTAFCGECGSPVFSQKGEAPQYVNVRLGGVQQRAELPPRLQGFCGSALAWARDIRDVPQVSGFRPGGTIVSND